jgi:hypothetical protein
MASHIPPLPPWLKIFFNNPLVSKRDLSKLGVIVLITSISLLLVIQVTVYASLQQQQLQPPIISVKITSHEQGQGVPVGELTISGTSTDNATTDCTVYSDWNNTKPFQKAIATGSGGIDDYSTWNYTYTNNYHLITNGTNDLTAKLSCLNNPTNLTKWNSVIVVGIEDLGAAEGEQQNSRGDGVTSSLPPVMIDKKDNNTNTAATITTTTTTPPPPSCCPSNQYTANAGPDQTVLEGTMITLNGSGNNNNKSSNVGDTAVANYLWRQTNGPAIILNGNNTAYPTFIAPNYPNDTKYTFALEVFENQINNNNNNQTGSAIDTVDIIAKDVNMQAKNPRSLQQEDSTGEEQSNQDELQGEGTTGGRGDED